MKKGYQVKIKFKDTNSRKSVFRHTSAEERNEWYEKLHTECQAGREVSYNCAGESKLAPMCIAIEVNDDDTFTVVRGRCCPTIGWHKQPKSALIRNNRTGEEGYIKRIQLELCNG